MEQGYSMTEILSQFQTSIMLEAAAGRPIERRSIRANSVRSLVDRGYLKFDPFDGQYGSVKITPLGHDALRLSDIHS